MGVEESLLDRIPVGASAGRRQTIQNVLGESLGLKGKITELNNDRATTPYGRGIALAAHVKKSAVPELLKAQRQTAYTKSQVEAQRAALRKKAIGEPKTTDPIWLDRLWGLPPIERIALIMRNAAARAAALREPDLAGIVPDNFPNMPRASAEKYFEDALRKTIIENHEPDLARLQVAEITQNIAEFSVRNLQDTILAAPVVTDKSTHIGVVPNGPIFHLPRAGEVRPFISPVEFSHYLAKEFPTAPSEATAWEKVLADAIDEAA